MTEDEINIHSLINQRRRQLLVHSFIYYRLNTNVIDDHKYDRFAMELIDLQEKYPSIAKKCIYHEAFNGFTMGDSFALPCGDPDVQNWAYRFLASKKAVESRE